MLSPRIDLVADVTKKQFLAPKCLLSYYFTAAVWSLQKKSQ